MAGRCPHGDPLCPCPDGDPCHYEGLDPMACPNPPLVRQEFGAGRMQVLDTEGRPAGESVPISGFVMQHKLTTEPHCHVEGCR
jgi:hypothetical protein